MVDLGIFNPTACDLCGSVQARTVVNIQTGRALRSDRVIVPSDLFKVECTRCGLVRSGNGGELAGLGELYSDAYSMSTEWEDHVFYTARGPLLRSHAFADWLTTAAGTYRWERAPRILEIGAGAGALLSELLARFPASEFQGVEVNSAAAQVARSRGLDVVDRIDDVRGPFDLIFAVAVIEHVPSPAHFLKAIRGLLRPGGLLYLCQPTQDVPSYDLFFVDHLHQFASEHLRAFAGPCGFKEVALVVGHEVMPNFSLHVWQAMEPAPDRGWIGPAVQTACARAAEQIQLDLARLDATLETLKDSGRPVAAFGVNEVFWLASAYSSLGAFPLACGLDDRPDQPHHARLGFPVVRPEACAQLGIHDVLLTMNVVHYPHAIRRLSGLGLRPIPIFSDLFGHESATTSVRRPEGLKA